MKYLLILAGILAVYALVLVPLWLHIRRAERRENEERNRRYWS